MHKFTLFLTALCLSSAMWAQQPAVSYQAPVYNITDDPTSGIKEWETRSCTTYTVVESAEEFFTWDAGWYVVKDEEVYLGEGVECVGEVHLILTDGSKLITNGAHIEGDIFSAGITVSGKNNSITIYGQANQSGVLIANGDEEGAGIGGSTGVTGENITINGGIISATGGESGAAGIGGGICNDGKNITINGGTVTAVGGKSYTTYSLADGAGIGGGEPYNDMGNGFHITINGGTITAIGGKNAAGIGGVNATDIYFNGGQVTAIGGNTDIACVGAYAGGSAQNIFVADSCMLKAGNVAPPVDQITHASTTDISDNLADKRYAVIGIPKTQDITFSQTGLDSYITAFLYKKVNATIGRTFFKDGEKNTICLPFALSAEQIASSPLAGYNRLQKFHSAEVINPRQDNETLSLSMTNVSAIEAGKPYIISWEKGENIVQPTFPDVMITTDEAGYDKSGDVSFYGTFVPVDVEGYEEKSFLFVGAQGQLNWPNVGGCVNGFRCYFIANVYNNSPIHRGMSAVFDKETPASLEPLFPSEKQWEGVFKRIESGRVIIIIDGIRYDLQGNMLQ